MKKIFVLMLIITVFAAGCGADEANIKELISFYSGNLNSNQIVWVTSNELIVDSGKGESFYKLPEYEFFVSIAPYINTTHPWTNHSLTGCKGEMKYEDFDILIVDNQNNEEVVKGKFNAGNNGFIDLWLPRNREFILKINHEKGSIETAISTFENSPTCLTDLKLI